ncbi:MAG TPA: hypothetical protein VGB87_04940 [Vicinamibacteria bacterium]
MRAATGALALLLALLAAPLVHADVVILVNGDRVTGRVVGRVTRRVRLQTPYGSLVIPAEKVERILRDNGREEVLNAPPAPPPAPAPPPPPVRLLVTVKGQAFWQAWDPKSAPEDPSLRLEVRLDDRPLATYTDVNLDPEDLPKAVVNSFVFSPQRLFVGATDGVAASPPRIAAAEIRLELAVPPELAGRRRLRLAYQVNDSGSAAPTWRDVVLAEGEVVLASGGETRVRVSQDRGTMDFTRRRMRNVETFRASLEADEPAPTP